MKKNFSNAKTSSIDVTLTYGVLVKKVLVILNSGKSSFLTNKVD